MPRPIQDEIVLTDDEAEAIVKSTMASYGMQVELIPADMRAQAKEGLKGLLRGLQLMGWTIERPKS